MTAAEAKKIAGFRHSPRLFKVHPATVSRLLARTSTHTTRAT